MRRVPPEFEIDEEPLALSCDDGDVAARWAALMTAATAADKAVADLTLTLDKAREHEASARRDLYIHVIEDVIDNLDRMIADAEKFAEAADPTTTQWLKRAKSTRRSLEALLARELVTPLNLVAAGHGVEVVDVEQREDVPEGTIVGVILRGWLWRGETLRPMKAVVASGPGADSAMSPPTATRLVGER